MRQVCGARFAGLAQPLAALAHDRILLHTLQEQHRSEESVKNFKVPVLAYLCVVYLEKLSVSASPIPRPRSAQEASQRAPSHRHMLTHRALLAQFTGRTKGARADGQLNYGDVTSADQMSVKVDAMLQFILDQKACPTTCAPPHLLHLCTTSAPHSTRTTAHNTRAATRCAHPATRRAHFAPAARAPLTAPPAHRTDAHRVDDCVCPPSLHRFPILLRAQKQEALRKQQSKLEEEDENVQDDEPVPEEPKPKRKKRKSTLGVPPVVR